MPISCQLYDTIEIVCMYHYPITLLLSDGSSVSGIALDTKRNQIKQECLELQGATGLVVLSSIDTMTVNIDNPHFQSISFG